MSYEQNQLLRKAYMSINDAINYMIKSNAFDSESVMSVDNAYMQLARVQNFLSSAIGQDND